MLATGNVKCLALPPRSPNLNAFVERWVGSVKRECLSRLILFGEGSLRRALTEGKYRCGERPAGGLFPHAQESGNASPYNKVPFWKKRLTALARPELLVRAPRPVQTKVADGVGSTGDLAAGVEENAEMFIDVVVATERKVAGFGD